MPMPKTTSAEFLENVSRYISAQDPTYGMVRFDVEGAERLLELAQIAVNGTKGERIKALEAVVRTLERDHADEVERLLGKKHGSLRHIEDLERQVREGAASRKRLEAAIEKLEQRETEPVIIPLAGVPVAPQVSHGQALVKKVLDALGIPNMLEVAPPAPHYVLVENGNHPPAKCTCAIGKNHMVLPPF